MLTYLCALLLIALFLIARGGKKDTRRACATYNFLSEEGRRVAGALLPPTVARPKPRMWSPTSNSTGQF